MSTDDQSSEGLKKGIILLYLDVKIRSNEEVRPSPNHADRCLLWRRLRPRERPLDEYQPAWNNRIYKELYWDFAQYERRWLWWDERRARQNSIEREGPAPVAQGAQKGKIESSTEIGWKRQGRIVGAGVQDCFKSKSHDGARFSLECWRYFRLWPTRWIWRYY